MKIRLEPGDVWEAIANYIEKQFPGFQADQIRQVRVKDSPVNAADVELLPKDE